MSVVSRVSAGYRDRGRRPQSQAWRQRLRRSIALPDLIYLLILMASSLAGFDLILRFGPHPFYVLNVALCALVAVAQLSRRTRRRASFLVTAVGLACYALVTFLSPVALGISPVCVAALATVHTMVRWEPQRQWWLASIAVGLLGALINPFSMLVWGRSGARASSPYAGVPWEPVLAVMVSCAVSVMAVAVDAMRRRRAERERLSAAAQQREAAVMHERLVIARELHDLVGHGLTAIKVQAATARAIDDGLLLRETMTSIENTAAASLSEVRELVHVLRTPTDMIGSLVGVEGIRQGVDTAVASGLNLTTNLADLDLEALSQRWSVLSRLAVVRVVQEGLTNALRHGGDWAHLELDVSADECRIHLSNGLSSQPAPPRNDRGHGLAGLAERVALTGGTLWAGTTPDRGGCHVLSARIPVRNCQGAAHE